jgi:uncharacterized protein (TIRG00374 family)
MLKKTILMKGLQLIFALAMFAALFMNIDRHTVSNLLSSVNLNYLLIASLVLIFQVIVASYRWLKFLRLAGFSPPASQCIQSFAVSSLVNSVLPGGVGGDITRMWITARNGASRGVAMYTVLVDRIFTLVGLGLLVTITLLLSLSWLTEMSKIDWFALALGISLLGGFIVLTLIAPLVNHFKISIVFFLSPIIRLSSSVSHILQHPRQLILLLSIIMLGHLMLISTVAILAYGLQIALPLSAIFVGIPVVLLFSSIPITPGGWGIRESTMVLVLSQFQVAGEAALSLSILFGIISTLANVPMATWWFIRKISVKRTLDVSFINREATE